MRKSPLRRRTPLTSGGRIKPSGETKRKKRIRYAAYLRSATWKEKRAACLLRAGWQCEVRVKITMLDVEIAQRCPEKATDAHHKHYQRFGGDEMPRDLLACCKRHHEAIEATLRPWNQNRRQA